MTSEQPTRVPTVEETAFARELHRHLHHALVVLEQCDRSLVSRREVTVAQSHTLLALPAQGAVSMHELSSAMNLAGSTMTRVVDQLVLKGLAERAPDEEDRRIVRVTLSERGRDVRAEVERDFHAVSALVAEQVEEKDREPFLRALGAVTKAMSDQCCWRPGA